MLELREVSKSFGAKIAVDSVSLVIPKGEFVAVIGRSGAGKSTLLRVIDRLVEPDAGDILWESRSVLNLRGRDLRDWRRRAAMIFQQFHLAPRLDVLTNVLIGSLYRQSVMASVFKQFPKESRLQALRELAALDIADTALQRAQTLSGGQQQRVAMARAMMQQPDLVLADEPISSLDISNAHTVMQALQRINRERGVTMLVNLHTLDMARRYASRVIGMASGRVIFDGSPSALSPDVIREIYRGQGGEIDPEFDAAA